MAAGAVSCGGPVSADPYAGEAIRVREAYARRTADDRYALADEGQLFLVQDVERHWLDVLRRHRLLPLAGKRVLEVGTGSGYWLRAFARWGARPADLHGVELLPERLAEAREKGMGQIRLQRADAARLPFRDGVFDLALQATVFSSVLDDAIRHRLAAELLRVLRPGGSVLWYDYHVDNPRNPDVRGVRAREVGRLFPGCDVGLRRVTLLPPLARWLAPKAWLACEVLARVGWLCTHRLGVITKG